MKTRIRLFVMITTITVLAILPACGAATPATPTTDPNAIYTQAVETVQAGLTETAAAAPTATFTPEPTATTPPTATPEPPTPTVETTLAQPQPGSATQAPAAPVTAPTVAMGVAGDHCQFGSQSPADGFSILGGEQKQVFWSLVNTGTTTWTTGYKLTWVGGRQMSGTTSVPVEKDVKPGEKYDFYTIIVGPTTKGTFTSYWKLVNSGGAAFCEVYLKWVVP